MPKVSFIRRDNQFYSSLKNEVERYFTENKIRKTGNWKLYLKSLILIPAAIGLYISLLTLQIPVFPAILMCALLGFILALIGFNVMHDACHGSFSSKKWVNEVFGLSMNALGGNAFIWKFKHNIVHHTYTNVDGVDEDIVRTPFIRMCSTQQWRPAHRFQHYYMIFLYSMSTLLWVFMMDFQKYFGRKVLDTPLQKMSRIDHSIFWLSKFLYALFYIAIPVYVVGWQAWAIGFTAMHLLLGFVLAIVFQLAHVVEHTEFEVVENDEKKIENEWAIHQVKTTADFSRRNKLISWMVGGLNYQIEHHLFPRVSHIHYPTLSKIVQQTCQKFELPYNSYDRLGQAVASHFRMMKMLGKKPAEMQI